MYCIDCALYPENYALKSIIIQDTDVVVWDLVNESGLYRLKGHKGPITQCHFLKERNMLITRYQFF